MNRKLMTHFCALFALVMISKPVLANSRLLAVEEGQIGEARLQVEIVVEPGRLGEPVHPAPEAGRHTGDAFGSFEGFLEGACLDDGAFV